MEIRMKKLLQRVKIDPDDINVESVTIIIDDGTSFDVDSYEYHVRDMNTLTERKVCITKTEMDWGWDINEIPAEKVLKINIRAHRKPEVRNSDGPESDS